MCRHVSTYVLHVNGQVFRNAFAFITLKIFISSNSVTRVPGVLPHVNGWHLGAHRESRRLICSSQHYLPVAYLSSPYCTI